tara:strand:- start:5402 stop:5845 length:444 start_codon:yes stop_codon:yes gene_type:complete
MKTDNKMKTYEPTNEGNPHSFAGYYAIEANTDHSLLAKYLVDATEGAVYSKPADKIAQAIKIMATALNDLVGWRLGYIAKHMPEILKLAQLYPDVYGSPNRNLLGDVKRGFIADGMLEESYTNTVKKLESYRTSPPVIFKGEANANK